MTDTTENQTRPTADPRPALAAAIDVTAEVMAAVRPEHLALPTPCDTMNVSELLSHLIMAADRISSAARADALDTWSSEGPSLAVDEWAPAIRTSGASAMAEWADDSRLERSTPLPWNTLPGAAVVAIYVNELVVHTWDLATAIGAPVEWSDELVGVASASIHTELPDADREAMWAEMAAHLPEGIPWESPFANAVEVDDDASPIERLVAWNGRTPTWTPS